MPRKTYTLTDGDHKKLIEGLHERTEHLDIFLFSAHHSMVLYFRCSVYWWKGSVRFGCFKILLIKYYIRLIY